MSYLGSAVEGLTILMEKNDRPVCEFHNLEGNVQGRCYLTGEIVNINYCRNRDDCPKYKDRMGELSS